MRAIRRAEVLAIGSELTVGETRDTNSGELAAALTNEGVEVLRMTALPDDLVAVRATIMAALDRVDLIVSTGGLGPTPDDLTREAIAEAVGESPVVDAGLETWIRGLFERRGIAFSDTNLKQAWVIPSAVPIPNGNGTAPGWWVDRPDGRIIVALPGPPRELRPMWTDWVVPRLRDRGLGQETATLTLRTTGMGESLIAERLGSLLDRGANPTVATYARADAVDVRISAVPAADGTAASILAEGAKQQVLARIGDHVWARGDVSWPEAIEAALAARDWTIAMIEIGTRGSVATLLAEGLGERLIRAIVEADGAHAGGNPSPDLAAVARSARDAAGADVGLAVRATSRDGDTAVTIAVASRTGEHTERRLAFLAGRVGRSRAALIAAAILLKRLR